MPSSAPSDVPSSSVVPIIVTNCDAKQCAIRCTIAYTKIKSIIYALIHRSSSAPSKMPSRAPSGVPSSSVVPARDEKSYFFFHFICQERYQVPYLGRPGYTNKIRYHRIMFHGCIHQPVLIGNLELSRHLLCKRELTRDA